MCGDYRACVDVCGDGITSGAEACDDANTQDADGNHASHCLTTLLTTTIYVSSYYYVCVLVVLYRCRDTGLLGRCPGAARWIYIREREAGGGSWLRGALIEP